MDDNRNGDSPQLSPPLSKSYTLTESERRHIENSRAQIAELEGEALRLEGLVRIKEREIAFLRRHLGFAVGLIAANAGLPMGSQLQADGVTLTAREG